MSQGDTQDEMELYNSVMPILEICNSQARRISKTVGSRTSAIEGRTPVSKRSSTKRVESIVTGGLVGSLFLSLILVFLFGRDISSRMQSLTYNSTRLPIREPLKPQVPGTDEISYLDFVLHDVAEQLDQVWKQRTTIMRMVARDLQRAFDSSPGYITRSVVDRCRRTFPNLA